MVGDDLLIAQARSLAESIDDFRELCITRGGPDAAVAALYDAAVVTWAAYAALGGDG